MAEVIFALACILALFALAMNPSDNQGVRFLIGEVQARKVWKE